MTVEEYRARLYAIDEEFAARISERITAIGRLIHPLAVSDGYVRKISREGPLADEYRRRQDALDEEFYACES